MFRDTDHCPVKGTQFASCRNQYICHCVCVLAKRTGLLKGGSPKHLGGGRRGGGALKRKSFCA